MEYEAMEPRYSRRAFKKARKRKLMAMTPENREKFLAEEAAKIANVEFVKKSIGRQSAVISSSPKQEDL